MPNDATGEGTQQVQNAKADIGLKMKVGEAAKELGVCPCFVPRLVRLGMISAKTTPEGELNINLDSVRQYKKRKIGRKYTRWGPCGLLTDTEWSGKLGRCDYLRLIRMT
jgi:hypothetical protein